MFRLHAKSIWEVSASLEDVYQLLIDASTWSRWWPDLEQSYLVDASLKDGIGSIWHFVWSTYYLWKLTFDIEVVEICQFKKITGIASGDLQGVGTWEFEKSGDGTLISYDWNVTLNQAWMRFLAPMMHKLFERNHEAIMRRGGEGLSESLGVALLRNEVSVINKC